MTTHFRTRHIDSGLYEVWHDGRIVGEVTRLTPEDHPPQRHEWEATVGKWRLVTDRKRTAVEAIVRHVTAPEAPAPIIIDDELVRHTTPDQLEQDLLTCAADMERYGILLWDEAQDLMAILQGHLKKLAYDDAVYTVPPGRRIIATKLSIVIHEALDAMTRSKS